MILSLFNRYFASVFTESSLELEELNEIYDPNQTALTELSLTNDEVRAVLLSLDVSKATGPDGIPARRLPQNGRNSPEVRPFCGKRNTKVF